MHRFFLNITPLYPNTAVDLAPLAHQLHDVLRLEAGAQIVLLDNRGDEFLTQIDHIERKSARATVLSQQPCRAEPSLHMTLYQCSLKADKFEWVLQKCTELGVSRFVPVISERSIVRPAAALQGKYERWQAIVREAAEQCGRGKIPELAQPLSFAAAVKDAQGAKLLAWEEGRLEIERLGHWVRTSLPISQSLDLLIGPEGGLTQSEAESAQSAGWQIVSLGPRVLRAETAAIAAVALVME